MKKVSVLLLVILALIGLAAFTEKTTRYTYKASVFNQKHVTVYYDWETGPPRVATDDPVNVGVARKWFGRRRYEWKIEIPSLAAFGHGGSIDRDAIVTVTPVEGDNYRCRDGFFTIVCKGAFAYRVDPRETLFMRNGNFVLHPPGNWLTDTRFAKLTVYKYF